MNRLDASLNKLMAPIEVTDLKCPSDRPFGLRHIGLELREGAKS
jgi:hypothetical protein